MHVIDRRAQLPALSIVAGGEVHHYLLGLVATLLGADEVDSETKAVVDGHESGSPTDQDRRLEVVAQPVDESTNNTAFLLVEIRHWFAAPNRLRRIVSP